eukprot:TRINITY_DN6952_c0_g1_i16.p1 TRINITY_DN6952_c0_g1~~TRINITY_DN6952_c0_g1_i16.p1  ORF type:complete len:293 (-),score=29.48 TRINITY_DN6952_c0_g1_i16:83-931(-)
MSVRTAFSKNGFYFPITLASTTEFQKIQAGYDSYVKRYGQDGKLQSDYRFRLHLVANWARDLVHNPILVSAVKDALNDDNILCWSTDINAKFSGTGGFYSWHQDSTYSGLEPSDKVLTAWVALSPSKKESGCLRFIPQSHSEQLPHNEVPSDSNLLSLGQVIPQDILDTVIAKSGEIDPLEAELEPGQASLHHWKCVHSSGVNSSDYDRIGFAIRYMSASVKNVKSVCRERATLVCGDPGDSWDIEPDIQEEYGDKEWNEHKISMELERKNYFQDSQVTHFK